ncbi:YfiR family protein [Ectothiorhodospiraceae bacterium BW-2]|nr:YfiR family protein [Ectothiorhodospiraceae bacterium BW-2]
MRPLSLLFALPLLMGLSIPTVRLNALTVGGEEVVAALLYNFAKFVEWPQESATSELRFCIAESRPLVDKLQRQGLSVRGMRLAIVDVDRYTMDSEIVRCHLLYIPAERAFIEERLLPRLQQAPLLLVGESEQFLEHGGVIRLFMQQGRIWFDISPDSANRRQLSIAAQLLDLARKP